MVFLELGLVTIFDIYNNVDKFPSKALQKCSAQDLHGILAHGSFNRCHTLH